ncbi:PorV/PorQ family protein [candidate division KSB1 bacterium]|nr:PorV/PorQ family protein [candidate division KSB1 bacterium]
MKFKTCVIVILLMGLCHHQAVAGDIVAGKYAGEFMATGVGARALGMGGAYVGIGDDVTAGYWNPAGLADLQYPELVGMYAERFAKLVNYNYGAMMIPASRRSSVALSVIRLAVDDIPVTALRRDDLELGAIYDGNKINTPYVVRTINDAEWAFYLSYAKRVSSRLAWGSNVKVVTKQIGDNSAWGLGFDLALLYKLYRNMNIGVNVQDITTTLLAWDTGRKEAITPTMKFGTAYYFDISAINSRLIPAIDFDLRFENRRTASQFNAGRFSFDSHLGLEYEFKHVVAVRLGSDVGHFTAGAGLRLPNLNIDYAFMSHDELGDTHRISLLLMIKEERLKRRP